MPSYEIFAPSCEIIMKIVNDCRKMTKNHEKIAKLMKKIHFTKYEKKCFMDFCFVTWNQCWRSQIIFPMNKIDRSWRDLMCWYVGHSNLIDLNHPSDDSRVSRILKHSWPYVQHIVLIPTWTFKNMIKMFFWLL